jgi:hypothetical protein
VGDTASDLDDASQERDIRDVPLVRRFGARIDT